MSDSTIAYQLSNSSAGNLVIYLEPWGEEYCLAPGESAELHVDAPAAHPMEWDFGEGKLVISSLGDADTSLSLWGNGERLVPR
jgi:hypothetical protein